MRIETPAHAAAALSATLALGACAAAPNVNGAVFGAIGSLVVALATGAYVTERARINRIEIGLDQERHSLRNVEVKVARLDEKVDGLVASAERIERHITENADTRKA